LLLGKLLCIFYLLTINNIRQRGRCCAFAGDYVNPNEVNFLLCVLNWELIQKKPKLVEIKTC